MSSEAAAAKIVTTNAQTPVVVWSKTYCRYCDRVLRLLASIEPRFPVQVLQLDERSDRSEIQEELLKLTSCMTAPYVFVNGKFIGGCTETTELHSRQQLLPLISAAVAAHVAGEGEVAAVALSRPVDEVEAAPTTTTTSV
jgi:glutaredoxin 3